MKISIIGTGYVGLVSAVGLAELGHEVWGVNRSPEKIEKLKKGQQIFYEPGLSKLLKKNLKKNRLHFGTDLAEAINNTDYVFICVGTPPKKDGGADLSAVKTVTRQIAKEAKKNLIVIDKSTVPIGTARMVQDILKKNKHKFEVVSSPEFLREGKAVEDFFHGDRLLIGADNKQVAKKVANLYAKLKTHKMITGLETAELTKYASNAFLATKISFINEIAMLCEKVGANVEEVAFGMGLDRRINQYFLNAGIGYGGSCFPKDVKALKHISKTNGFNFKILEAVLDVNVRQRKLVFNKAKKELGALKGKTVTVLGLAFKDNTDDIRESPAIDLIKWFSKAGSKVKAYDREAQENSKELLKDKAIWSKNPYEACSGSQLVIIATEWPSFKTLDWSKIKRSMKKKVIIDGKNILSKDKMEKLGFKYIGIGK